jgi:ribonuclease BN (tRNA processing enzyme)
VGRELDKHASGDAASAVHQDRLTGPEVDPIGEGLVGGERRDGECCGGVDRDPGWDYGNVSGGRDELLRPAARFDTPDGSIAFSGDTTVNENLTALARGADILIHQVADLNYLKQHGTDDAELARMAALHTDVSQVGGVATHALVRELILSHYLPADPAAITAAEWAKRAGRGFSGTTTADHDGLRRTLPRPVTGG